MKKFIAAAAILFAAVGPAYSGPKGDTVNQIQKQQDEAQKRDNKDVDKAYNQMLNGTRGDSKPYDPWGSVRPTDGTKKADGTKK